VRQQSTKVRGMAQASLDLIEAMQAVARAAQPITGRAHSRRRRARTVTRGKSVGPDGDGP
jgi:hypothetical protein